MDDNQLLDLDALIPQQKTVKLNGVTYKVNPPALRVLPELSRKLDQLSKLENTTDVEEIAQALDSLNETIRLVMPDLPDDADLTVEQSTALIQLIMDMIVSPDQKALAKEGLLPDAQKKTDLVS